MDRCVICGWTLAKTQEGGCIPGDCSYRPDDPAEQTRLLERRELVKRAHEAVMTTFERVVDEAFPLYDREAREIAEAVIRAIETR